MSIQERRQCSRLDVNLPVTLRHNGRLIPATVLNISCGGMCLSCDQPELTSEGNAEIIFDLSSEELDVSIRGKVVRVTPGINKKQVGIQFTNLFSVGHQAIEEYVKKHMN